MTIERVIELLRIERECVDRNNQPFGLNCDRDCGRCDLVQNPDELITMYTFVIDLLQARDDLVIYKKALDMACDRLGWLEHDCKGCILEGCANYIDDKKYSELIEEACLQKAKEYSELIKEACLRKAREE